MSAIENEKFLKEMDVLLNKKVKKVTDQGDIMVGFTKKGNKHLYSDIIRRSISLQKEELKNLHIALEKSTFVKSSQLGKKRKDDITKFYYFKDREIDLYYNIAERIYKHNGIEHVSRFLYSATKGIK